MKKNKRMPEDVNQKKQWKKPVLTKMDVANVTKGGSFTSANEDPYHTFYGPS